MNSRFRAPCLLLTSTSTSDSCDALLGQVSGSDGVRGLYAGFGATLLHDVTYAAIQFALLEQLRLLANELVGGRPLTTVEDGSVGFTVGLVSATITEPLDLVRTRIMTQRRSGQSKFKLPGSGYLDLYYD